MVSTQAFQLELIFYRAICHSFIFAAFPRNWQPRTRQLFGLLSRDLSQESAPSGAFFSLRCLIYKVHASSAERRLLYIASFRLSRTFFKVFWHPIRYASSATFLVYHVQEALSRTFFQKFQDPAFCSPLATFKYYHVSRFLSSVFSTLFGAVLTASTALLEYQTFHLLSTLFCVFLIFIICFSYLSGPRRKSAGQTEP